MKIMQILPSMELGGVERGVVDLVRAMQRKGEQSVVVSSGGSLVKELEKTGIPHYTLPVHKKSLSALMLIPKLAEIIRQEKIDMVHARSRVPAWIAYFAARRAGVPFVTTCHGYYSHHFFSKIMGWGSRVIVISRVIGRRMVDDFGVKPDRVRLIHRGVDLQQFPCQPKPLRTQPPSKDRPFVIVNIGRLSPIKGQVEFIQAVHELRRRVPFVEAWLIGSEGKGKTKYTQEIQDTIEHLGLQHCVKMMGVRRDIPDLLKKADALVLSTLVPEAFGRVIAEAGAAGVPVIATRLGGVLDIIDHGQNGLLVSPGHVPEMADAMEQLIQHPDQAKQYAEALRQKVESCFTLDHMIQKTLAVYRELLEEKRILMIKLGSMGDVILATPSMRMLRERFPKAEITLLIDRKWAPLVSALPYLNDIMAVDRAKIGKLAYLLKLAKKIRREGFDLSVDLQNSKWTHLLAFLGGVKRRYGFSRGKFGFLLNQPDHSFHTIDAPVKHQFRILSKLGVREFSETLELSVAPDAEASVKNQLQEVLSLKPKPVVGLVLGASPKWPTKRWPLESYQALADRVIKELDALVVLTGSVQDQAGVFSYFPAAQPGILNLVGKTSLQELAAWIDRMDVIVTGDTAPLHIASAMRTKIVALFGPTDYRRHMPPSPSASVLHRSLSCQPCYSGECKNPETLACLRHISVQEVFESVKKQLNQKLEAV